MDETRQVAEAVLVPGDLLAQPGEDLLTLVHDREIEPLDQVEDLGALRGGHRAAHDHLCPGIPLLHEARDRIDLAGLHAQGAHADDVRGRHGSESLADRLGGETVHVAAVEGEVENPQAMGKPPSCGHVGGDVEKPERGAHDGRVDPGVGLDQEDFEGLHDCRAVCTDYVMVSQLEVMEILTILSRDRWKNKRLRRAAVHTVGENPYAGEGA